MNKRTIRLYERTILSLLIVLLQFAEGLCEIRLPKLISDGAILQRDVELKIWGWASPNERVELQFNNENFRTKADADGNWHLMIPPQKAGGPYEIAFKGVNKIIVRNVLFGEVWLCSGQSNMELTMKRLKDKYPDEIANSANANIRQFLVPDNYDFVKIHSDLESGSWLEANPDNLFQFSGVAYFFARELYNKYKVPIGLINAALGGSPVEAWMSEDALRKFPSSWEEMQRFKDADFIEKTAKSDQERQQKWYADINEKDKGLKPGLEWYLENTNDSDWDQMEVPGFWADQELGQLNGVVWFRKTVNVSKGMASKKTRLWLGRIVDQDHVYVNGEYVGNTGYQYPPRKYELRENLLREGENLIAVRVINSQGRGGFIVDKPYFLATENDSIDLKGKWKYKLGTTMNPLASPTFIRWKPGGLYNKMIAPLVNYRIRGAIWYQGESNTNDPKSYFDTFPALITNWREKWKIGSFPFLFVQLANFMEESEEPTESDWAELRQAQLETLAVPNTGMAVITDLGEWNDIHPLNKRDVSKRLAQQALRLAYREEATVLCPVPSKSQFLAEEVKVSFDFVKNGLISKNGGPLEYFEVSSDGKKFIEANAKISGSEVIIWNEQIPNPIAVRYAWADNPKKANLVSKEGLPVSPFELRKN